MNRHQTTSQLTPEEREVVNRFMLEPAPYADLRNGGMMEPAYQRRACAAVLAATVIGLALGMGICAAMVAVWGA